MCSTVRMHLCGSPMQEEEVVNFLCYFNCSCLTPAVNMAAEQPHYWRLCKAGLKFISACKCKIRGGQ